MLTLLRFDCYFILVVTAYGDSAISGTDFQAFTAAVTFGYGIASVTDTIDIIDDDAREPSETFRIVIIEADGEIDEDNNEVTVTINDNDGR